MPSFTIIVRACARCARCALLSGCRVLAQGALGRRICSPAQMSKHELSSEDILRAFRSCPKLDWEYCRHLLPKVLDMAEMVSKTKMVSTELGFWALVVTTAGTHSTGSLAVVPCD